MLEYILPISGIIRFSWNIMNFLDGYSFIVCFNIPSIYVELVSYSSSIPSFILNISTVPMTIVSVLIVFDSNINSLTKLLIDING